MLRRVFVVFSALSIAGCGSTTFGGLGDDDDGGGDFPDTGTGDAIFPTDDATGTDTAGGDSTLPRDTGLGADGSSVDTSGGDGAAVDSASADTGGDSGLVDTGVPDSGPIDSGAVDSAPPDTGPLDTGSDTPTVTWTNVVGKVGCYDTESSPERAVQCDKDCCANFGIDFSWHWKCGDGCGFGNRTYSCDETADCGGGGKVCCTTTNGFGTINGSGCQTSCGGNKMLCATSTECSTPKTCKAFTPPDAKYTIGACE